MRDSSGKFQKGFSGNAGGRPREIGAVRDLAKRYTQDAIEALVGLMADPTTPPAARVSAAVALLDRGHGKPAQSLDMRLDAADPALAHIEAIRALTARRKAESETVDPTSTH